MARTRFRVRMTDAFNGGVAGNLTIADLGNIVIAVPAAPHADVIVVLTITDGPFLPEEIINSVSLADLIDAPTAGLFVEHSTDGTNWLALTTGEQLRRYQGDDQVAADVPVDVSAGDLNTYTSSTNVQDILEEVAGDLISLTAASRSWAYSSGRRGNGLNLSQDLRNNQNVPTNLAPFLVPEDATIVAWSAYATSSGGGTDYSYDVLVNDVSIAGFPRTVSSGTNTDFIASLAVDVSAGDEIRVRYIYNDDAVDMIHTDLYLVAR